MSVPIEVRTDNSGRINHYLVEGVAGNVAPSDMAQYIEGGERLTLKGAEYNLMPNGSLIHPSVDLTDAVQYGSGVLLGEGTTFPASRSTVDRRREGVIICMGAKILGTAIHDEVVINKRAFILADTIGRGSIIGEGSRLVDDVRVGSDVFIGDFVKIDRKSSIGNGAKVGDTARLGYWTVVEDGAIVPYGKRIGQFVGSGNVDMAQSGELVRASRDGDA